MSIRSHPQPSTLVSYASGTLPGAIGGVVACHLSVCGECHAAVRRLEIIGGLLLEDLDTPSAESGVAELAAGRAFNRALEKVTPELSPRSTGLGDRLLPLPLAQYLGMGIDEIPWKSLPKGIKQYWVKLPKDAGLMRLLKVPPRTKLLEHSHHGMEVTMVLTGTYSDNTGDYGPGEVTEMDVGMEHQPGVSSDEECICIVASEKPPHYSRWYARLLRPIIGF